MTTPSPTPSLTQPPIQLYAELLVNIRKVSVSASFQGQVDTKATIAQVLPDGLTLRVSVDRSNGQQHTATLTLPGQVAVGASGSQIPLQGPALASGYVAWRFPLSGQAGQTGGQSGSDDSDLAPWSAPDLQPGSSVSCRACSSKLVSASRITTWKDLPSDNWAEMMEFWHCHKPDVKKGDTNEKNGDSGLADRGYGANSIISAEAGLGFVDLTTLLFSETDCQGLLVSPHRLLFIHFPPTLWASRRRSSFELYALHHSMSTDTNALDQFSFTASSLSPFG